MLGLRERRKFERFEDESSIVFSIAGSGNYNNSRTFNCSMGGMCFLSDEELPRGADVCIKMMKYPSVFYAEVARCREIVINGNKCYYIGIKYLEPI